jgi:hypothetical protein
VGFRTGLDTVVKGKIAQPLPGLEPLDHPARSLALNQLYSVEGVTVNDELVSMWKKAAIVLFMVLSC